MSDIKLFRLSPSGPVEIAGASAALETSLQTLIEKHLEAFLGVRFLATEYSTGKDHGGRMDTLGIDENGCPVIIEYKRSSNENVINQGLFYLDWLMDHRKDFEWLVMDKYGKDAAASVEWSSPRLLCIAGDFTKYDSHAVKQMNRRAMRGCLKNPEPPVYPLVIPGRAKARTRNPWGNGTMDPGSRVAWPG